MKQLTEEQKQTIREGVRMMMDLKAREIPILSDPGWKKWCMDHRWIADMPQAEIDQIRHEVEKEL